MKRSRYLGLAAGGAALALVGGVGLALIWDRLPIDPGEWRHASDRVADRARQQLRAEQAADDWSQVLRAGLSCGGEMAFQWANLGSGVDLRDVAAKVKATCAKDVAWLVQVAAIPAPDRLGEAVSLYSVAPEPGPMRLPRRALPPLEEAATTRDDAYAAVPGDAYGILQVVPVRRVPGALLLLRYRPDAAAAASDGTALSRILDTRDDEPGIPIRAGLGLRVAIGTDALDRRWIASAALALMLFALATVARTSRQLRRRRQELQATEERGREIDRLQAELQERGTSEMIGELAYALAHNLTQPAAAIDQSILNLERAAGDSMNADMTIEAGAIRTQVEQLHAEIADILQYVKSDTQLATCRLRDVVDEAFKLRRRQAVGRSTPLNNRVSAALVPMPLPRLVLLHVLLNLIDNALYWMKDTPLEKRHITVEEGFKDGKLLLSVQDHGSGIEPDKWDRIFEKGQSGREGGRGLALWASRRLLRRLKGDVLVSHSDWKGTSMLITLPCVPLSENTNVQA